MTSVPTGNAVVDSVATPPAFNVPVPREVLPLLNVTVPVGVPEADVTVAVSATLAPATIAVGFAVTVVAVAVNTGTEEVTVTVVVPLDAAKDAVPP